MRYHRINEADASFLCRIFSVDEYELYFAENETTEDDWRERITDYFCNKQSFIIETDDGTPVGWVMYGTEGNVCELDIIVLLDAERGKGYGRQALHDLVLDGGRFDTLLLDVQKRNTKAVALYRRMGFKVVGEELQPVADGEQEYYKMKLHIG